MEKLNKIDIDFSKVFNDSLEYHNTNWVLYRGDGGIKRYLCEAGDRLYIVGSKKQYDEICQKYNLNKKLTLHVAYMKRMRGHVIKYCLILDEKRMDYGIINHSSVTMQKVLTHDQLKKEKRKCKILQMK